MQRGFIVVQPEGAYCVVQKGKKSVIDLFRLCLCPLHGFRMCTKGSFRQSIKLLWS